MNNDASEMLKNFSQMMNNKDFSDSFKNIMNNFKENSESSNNDTSNTNTSNNNTSNNNTSNNNTSNNNSSNTDFSDNARNSSDNFDINTFFKMQQIMSSLNNNQDDSRANLLRSLKPYLKDSRKNKVDQYIQLMKMGKIFEIMNPLGGDNKNVK